MGRASAWARRRARRPTSRPRSGATRGAPHLGLLGARSPRYFRAQASQQAERASISSISRPVDPPATSRWNPRARARARTSKATRVPPTAPPALAAGTLAEGERLWPLRAASERARETARDAGTQRSSSSAPPRAPRAFSAAPSVRTARAEGAEPSRRWSSTHSARRKPRRAFARPRGPCIQSREARRSRAR